MDGDLRECSVADASARGVDDAAQRDRILRVIENLEVGNDVADLLALVKAGAAHNLVRQPGAHEHVLQRAGGVVGAVHDGDIPVGHALVDESVDLACDEAGLVVLVIRHIAGDFLALPEVGPQLLGSPLGIAVDHGVRRGEDGLRGAVVLLQEDGVGVRVVALEFLDIADRRAAEGVNGLVRITHHGELAAATALLADEGGDQHVLRVVGVLILVDEHVPEATAVVLRDLRVSAQDADDLADQVVEVHGVRRPEALLIIRVQGGDGLLVEVAVRVRLSLRGGRPDELVLPVADGG